ncbi:hypothetical protein NQZ68_027563 [Dissostichus eleginoides]|nr:hypothetical protein NQZ68_027563 [Dissostichus eleginoides]
MNNQLVVGIQERGGGADWVTPIPTYDSHAGAETPYRMHNEGLSRTHSSDDRTVRTENYVQPDTS